MQNPEEDTEWNDILRAKGILPPKKVNITDDEPPPPPDLESQLDQLNAAQLNKHFDLANDAKIDDDEAKFLEEYRRKRIAMLKEEQARSRFGSVREVSKSDWKTEVNEAAVGDVYVIIHISQRGHHHSIVVDERLRNLAAKYPMIKFLRGEAALCIPNYPDRNLPTLLIYHHGELVQNLVGVEAIGGSPVTVKSLENLLTRLNVLKTKKVTKDSSQRIEISLKSGQRSYRIGEANSSEDDGSDLDD